MPYINKEAREELDTMMRNPKTEGELNYCLTREIQWYLDQSGRRYSTYNEVLGVLEAVKLELYRREIAPYEDKKIKENGDVY